MGDERGRRGVTAPSESFELKGSDGRPVRGDVHRAASATTGIVLCHGFKGFGRFSFFPYLAEQLADAGFNAVSFDFSGSGVGEDRERFTEQDAFYSNTFTKELHDLEAVIAEATRRGWIGSRFGLFGFSRGGGIVILRAARDERVGALVTWSSISTINRWPAEEIDAWRERGYAEVTNSRTGDVLRVGTALIDEIEHAEERGLDIQEAAARVKAPWLIVHGTSDETVNMHEARQLHSASGNRAELALVERANHGYNAKHGVAVVTPELDSATKRTVRFFSANLTGTP